MLAHVPGGDRIGDALKAQDLDQPIEDCRRVMTLDGLGHASVAQVSPKIIEIRRGPGEPTGGADEVDRVIAVGPSKSQIQAQCHRPPMSNVARIFSLERSDQRYE